MRLAGLLIAALAVLPIYLPAPDGGPPPNIPTGFSLFNGTDDAGRPISSAVLPDGGQIHFLGIGGPIAPQSATRLVEA